VRRGLVVLAALPMPLPQHGRGRKHLRRIELASWQEAIAVTQTGWLLRGLIHSDGCRSLNRVNGNEYPRYFFTNRSGGILQIFRGACDVLGIRYRDSTPHTISIARRENVAALDSFVGPKT
jgi:hypothetical protein